MVNLDEPLIFTSPTATLDFQDSLFYIDQIQVFFGGREGKL